MRKSTRTPHLREFLLLPRASKAQHLHQSCQAPEGTGRLLQYLLQSLPATRLSPGVTAQASDGALYTFFHLLSKQRFRQGCGPAPPSYSFTGGERYTALDRSSLEQSATRVRRCSAPSPEPASLCTPENTGSSRAAANAQGARPRSSSESKARSRFLPVTRSRRHTAQAAPRHVNDAITVETKKAITTSEAALNYGMGRNK